MTVPAAFRVMEKSRFCALTVVTVTGGKGADAALAGALAALAAADEAGAAAPEAGAAGVAPDSGLPEQAAKMAKPRMLRRRVRVDLGFMVHSKDAG
jgi:hypothetical protein